MSAMENVQKTYSDFHRAKQSRHVYPTEWVIRTLLGKYPHLELDKSKYPGARMLDLGFGDCRNMPLLANCDFDIHGVEISDDILALARDKLQGLNIAATLKRGTNTHIPFPDKYFDYVLACHSCYYVDGGTSFDDNLAEIARVMKPHATFVASLPAPGNFILENCKQLDDGHVMITNDPYGLRNGYIFRVFADERDIEATFAPRFQKVVTSRWSDDAWGMQINFFVVVGERA
jgi:ubiquinone/menaquinone biosynthesis C-methylase UbiE